MGRRVKNLHRRTAYLLDKRLYELLINGRPIKDASGAAIIGPDGQPLRDAPSAADLTVIARRLRNLGVGKHTDPDEEPGGIPAWIREARRQSAAASEPAQDDDPPPPAPIPDWAKKAREKLAGAVQ